jgi:cytochrome c2
MTALVILMARSVCASQADQQRVQRLQKSQSDDDNTQVCWSRAALAASRLALTIMAEEPGAQGIAAGEAFSRKCRPCHDVGENAKNKIGANTQ